MMYLKDDKSITCKSCKRKVIQLITEGLPKRLLYTYPEGICKDCKRKYVNRLKKLLR